MIIPRLDEPQTMPVAKFGSYLYLRISGIATWLNTVADATLTPVTAANTALPITVAAARPPGTFSNILCAHLNRSPAEPETAMIVPMSMKRGITQYVYVRIALNAVVESTLSAVEKLLVTRNSPTKLRDIRVNEIWTPANTKTNSNATVTRAMAMLVFIPPSPPFSELSRSI